MVAYFRIGIHETKLKGGDSGKLSQFDGNFRIGIREAKRKGDSNKNPAEVPPGLFLVYNYLAYTSHKFRSKDVFDAIFAKPGFKAFMKMSGRYQEWGINIIENL